MINYVYFMYRHNIDDFGGFVSEEGFRKAKKVGK